MRKMIVASIGIAFDPDEKENTLSINFPKHAEILSVKETEVDDNHFLKISFMYPAENSLGESEVWHEFQFLITKCAYVNIEIDNHNYIGNIDVEDDTYAVFYKEMQHKKA